jgi:APA family basic amino acid/polyamine antiporter
MFEVRFNRPLSYLVGHSYVNVPQLQQRLSTFGLTMIAIGSCVGSGIFLTPSMIAGFLPSEGLILGVWALGGLVALAGALSLAYMGMYFRETGGVYVYLRERYGAFTAFAYGWIILTVVTSGAIAALGMAMARYVDFIIPLGQQGIVLVAIAAIVIVTLINLRGVGKAEMFSNIFTIAKLLGIIFIIGCGAVLYKDLGQGSSSQAIEGTSLWAAAAGAMIGIIWSYGGWHHASYLAGEAKQPEKSVPRAMVIGVIVVTVVYVMTNWAYLRLIGHDAMAASSAVASDALAQHFEQGALGIAILIVLSTFGTMGIYTLSAPRIYYTMAKDGVFLPKLAEVHPKFRTPVFAILLQSGWAIILVLFWGTFENLITYVVFMDWVFMALAVFAVFHFYKKRPHGIRYKIPLYPLTPIFFLLVSAGFLVRILLDNPAQAWAGLLLLASGWPVYLLYRRVQTNEHAPQ